MNGRTITAGNVRHAVDGLRSLRDGDLAVAEATACGPAAIMALRELLFEREPSGLFDGRCRAVEVLACLGAFDVLMEFLGVHVEADDAVERLGDDAVVNAAAGALKGVSQGRALPLLIHLANKRLMPGVIRAIGAIGRREAIPHLLAALEEDECRPFAEAALKKMGTAAYPALLAAIARPLAPDSGESKRRAVRSVLRLLAASSAPEEARTAIKPLIQSADPSIAVLAAQICLQSPSKEDRADAIARLVKLLPTADWMLQAEIEELLRAHDGTLRKPADPYRSG
jgi:hypothetical protein